MDKLSKYLVFHMVRHSDDFYAQTPEQEAQSQEAINRFVLSWAPKVRMVLGSHAVTMAGEWDYMCVFTMDELSDWEAMREEYRRRFQSRTTVSLSLPGVAHEEFVRATAEVPHYVQLRRLGCYPGEAEGNGKHGDNHARHTNR
jgi:hypothetical protein